jgi:hypothetical protein
VGGVDSGLGVWRRLVGDDHGPDLSRISLRHPDAVSSTCCRWLDEKLSGNARAEDNFWPDQRISGVDAALVLPRNARTGKPETTAFRAILGNDALYLIQRAFRSVPQPDQLAATMKFLGAVSVCDVERLGHPCPSATPSAVVPSAKP